MLKSRDCGIQIWFWPRNSPNTPLEILYGGLSQGEPLFPNPTWGPPAADFPLDPSNCAYDQFFNAHQMVFDLTFCVRGDFVLPVLYVFSRTRLRIFLLHRVIGLAILGRHPGVV